METRPSKNKEMGKGCLSSIFSMGLFLLIGLGLSFWGWTILQNARASASWPIAEGRVTNSEVNHTTDAEGGDSYSPEITYTYAVNDTNHNNSTIKFGENSYSSRKKAEEILSNYPVGKNVTVYYDPEKPDRSVLEPGVSAGSFIVLGIGVFFILITLAILPISFFLRNRG
jgi:hypothetical protein